MESIRQQKVNKLLALELAELLRQESKGYFLGAFISVTGVRISPDLGFAKVYVSIMQEPLRKPVMELLTQHQSYIRKKLALKVGKQLRVVPELHFYIDDSLDYALHIDTLLKK